MRVSGWGVGLGSNPTFCVTIPGGSVVKNPSANGGDVDLIPGSGRSPGEGNGNPIQYSCLGNPMDRGAWWATIHEVAKSQIWLSDWAHVFVCAHTHTHTPVQPLSPESCLFVMTQSFSVLSPDSSEKWRWRITLWRTITVKWGKSGGKLLQWPPRKAGLTVLRVV